MHLVHLTRAVRHVTRACRSVLPRGRSTLRGSRAGLLAAALGVTFVALAFPAYLSAMTTGEAASAPSQLVPRLVVNEIDYMQEGIDDREFVEIVNYGLGDANLSAYDLLGIDGRGLVYRRDDLPEVILGYKEHFVIGSADVPNVDLIVDGPDVWNDYISSTYQTNAIALVESPFGELQSDILIDSISYGGSTPGGPPSGGTWTEDAGVTFADDEGAVDIGISRDPDGADTDENYIDVQRRCITPGYTNSQNDGANGCAPVATRTPTPLPMLGPRDLMINEFDYNNSPDSPTDFVEIYNRGSARINLSTYHVLGIDAASGTPVEYVRIPLPPIRLNPGEYYVVGNRGVPNVDQEVGTDDIFRTNFGDGPLAIALVYSDGGGPEEDLLSDSVSYEGSTPGGPDKGGSWTEGTGIDPGDPGTEPNWGFSRWPNAADSNVNKDDFAGRCITPGSGNSTQTGNCGAPPTLTATSTSSTTPTPTGSTTPTQTPTRVVSGTRTATPTETSMTPTPTATRVDGRNRFIVDTPGDGPDTRPGDGACVSEPERLCSLRAALEEVMAGGIAGDVSIEFLEPMRITVGEALPTVDWDGLTISASAHARSGTPGVVLVGDKTFPALEILSPGVTVEGLQILDFSVGIVLRNGADGALLGSDGDGFLDETEGIWIAGSRLDAIQIWPRVSDARISRCTLEGNGRHGIHTYSTRGPGNTFTRNRITDNGGGAIAVFKLGSDAPVPVVRSVAPAAGRVSGTACPSCRLELYGDFGDEAALYLRTIDVPLSGDWTIEGLDLTGIPNVTASATGPEGSTSRLSDAKPVQAPWRVVDVAPFIPRLLGRDLGFARDFRVVDEAGRPIEGAVLWLGPQGIQLTTGPSGLFRLRVPLAPRLAPGERFGLSVTRLTANGETRSFAWSPAIAGARGQPSSARGEFTLDLSEFGPRGIGMTLDGEVNASASTTARGRADAEPDQSGAQVYGAGLTTAPTDSREGPHRWQENIARGGALYEVRGGESGASGEIRITAPIEAYNSQGPASACQDSPAGAVVTGWQRDKGCWVPIEGTSADTPDPAANTYEALGIVEIAPEAAQALRAAGLRSAGLHSAGLHSAGLRGAGLRGAGLRGAGLHATGAFTLFTAGYDVESPVITMTVGAAVSGMLPEVVAIAADRHSGVDAESIVVTLDDTVLAASYDHEARNIGLASSSRLLPSGFETGELKIELYDGFCNPATASAQIRLGSPVRIFIPSAEQR